jgi:hypothetical protein
MLLNWTMPRHRAPTALETLIDTTLSTICTHISAPFRATALEYWFLDPQGQFGTLFLALLLGTLIWFAALEHSSTRAKKRCADRPILLHEQPNDKKGDEMQDDEMQDDEMQGVSYPRLPTPETPVMAKLAPPGHRPVNADLGSAARSFKVVNPLAHGVALHTPIVSRRQERNLSAPVSLRGNGMLNEKGTPRRKWAAMGQMPLAPGFGGEKKEEEVVAWWLRDEGSSGGRVERMEDLA